MNGWLALRWLWAAIRCRLPRRARGRQPGPAEVLGAVGRGELTPMSFGFRPGSEPGAAQLRRVPEGQFTLISWGPVLDPPWPLPDQVTGGQPGTGIAAGGQPIMCAVPGDCPLGPGPHPLTVPNDHTKPCCCRQPWETSPPERNQ